MQLKFTPQARFTVIFTLMTSQLFNLIHRLWNLDVNADILWRWNLIPDRTKKKIKSLIIMCFLYMICLFGNTILPDVTIGTNTIEFQSELWLCGRVVVNTLAIGFGTNWI